MERSSVGKRIGWRKDELRKKVTGLGYISSKIEKGGEWCEIVRFGKIWMNFECGCGEMRIFVRISTYLERIVEKD